MPWISAVLILAVAAGVAVPAVGLLAGQPLRENASSSPASTPMSTAG